MKLFKGVLAVAVVVAIGWLTYGLFAAPKETGVEPAAGEEGGAPGQPMPVKVATLQSKEVQLWHAFSGKLVAVDTVDVRPRVGGAIQEIYFQPGQIVEKDAPLFLIDPRPYEAEVNRLAAALTVAQTQAVLAKSEAARSDRLIKENALSQREYDERQNNNRVAVANVKAASAALAQAKLNLTYATITAPIRGKISRAEITQGNLVDPASPQVLATIVSVDDIYADFDVDEATYLKSVRQKAVNPTTEEHEEDQTPVQLVLSADQSVVYDGKIVAFDNKLDPTAGTIRARAIFNNKDQALVPGMFADIRLGNPEKQNAIVIPERIVNTDQDKKFVYVIDDKNTVTYRPVKLGQAVDGMRVVEEGLKPGERVAVKGIQRLHPGMPVAPQEVPLVEDKTAENTAAASAPSSIPGEAPAAGQEKPAGELTPTEAPTPEVSQEAASPSAEETASQAEALPEPAQEDQSAAQEAVPADALQEPAQTDTSAR